jgi:hypothetical protein
MKIVSHIVLSFFLLTLAFNSLGQQSKPMRVEISCQEDVRPYEVVSLGSQGMLVYYKAQHPAIKNEANWTFNLFDVNLKTKWTQEKALDDDFEYVALHQGEQHVSFVFLNSAGRSKSDQIRVMKVDKMTGKITMTSENVPEKCKVVKYIELDTMALTGLNTHDDHAVVLMTSLKSGKSGYLKTEIDFRSSLENILVNPVKKTFTLFYEFFPEKRHSVFKIVEYSLDGKPIETYPVLDFFNKEKTINAANITRIDSSRILLLGSYSNSKSKTVDQAEDKTEESTGFFSCLIRDNKIDTTYFYNFLDFKKFFNKVRANQAIYKAGTNNKKELSSDYRLILHDILNNKGEFLFLAEAYYPEYHTVTNWTYDYYGHMIPNYYTIFDGYRYNNAFIAGFDSTGKLKWDNSLELNNIITLRLRKRVIAMFDNDQIILAYSNDGKIANKVIQKDQTIENTAFSEVEFTDSHDRLISDDNSNILFWYKNYFLAYGYQIIKNSSRSSSRREVFYLNKVTYR